VHGKIISTHLVDVPSRRLRLGRKIVQSSRLLRAIKPLSVAGVLLLGVAAAPPQAAATTTGANGTHDPSRMIESDGKFYVYSTGGGSKSSTDGLAWTQGPGLFPSGIPQTTTSVVSSNEGVWAPDLLYLNGQYYLYYSIANAQNACAIGLITSPTLNPSSPSYKWTDHGLVVSNTGSDTYCTIDPAPLLDASGDLWLSWGSGYSHPSTSNTIWVTRLDNTTGLPSSTDTAKPGHPLEQGHIEASYLYYHSSYYYLFWNSGGCCSGASSSYEIHVARSQTITGPYTGSKIFYSSTGSIHGPGQIGIYDQCGADRFTYHYYPDTGGSVLGENELSWGSDGWPVVGAESTTPLTPCGQTGSGGTTGAGGTGGTGGALGGASGTDGGTIAGSPNGGALGAGSAGAPGASGSSALGGAAGNAPASGAAGSTGVEVAGSAGLASSAGSAGTTDGSAASGCSCRVGGARGSNGTTGGLLFIGAALEALRRCRKRRGQC
jgi:arabinan endo-1,5-alpha-L-arabinosidase